ncbi:HEAT repeat domain-containing protein [Streptomyces aureus]|uniref:HEAT repeat domain-containing protein n=1 Tax=Streptomyces aureus TaxID=193461 RepID=UPI00368B6EB2
MINELDLIDWSSMNHAYGPADEIPGWLRAMASMDRSVGDGALSDFYGAVHHQGDVYVCTTASLPFLFALADDPVTPDRASVVELLVSIGRHAVERCMYDYAGEMGYAGSAVVVRERADAFVSYAADDDPAVRRAAVEGLGLFIDDAGRAAGLLRDRMSAERGARERLPIVEAMATLALRLPEATETATAWFDGLAGDVTTEPVVRLAAVVQRARCAPDLIDEELVPTAIGLLRRIPVVVKEGPEGGGNGCGTAVAGSATGAGSVTDAEADAHSGVEPESEAVSEAGAAPGVGSQPRDPARTAPEIASPTAPQPAPGVPPQVLAAFEDLDRSQLVHSPATPLLRALHEVLDSRVPERSALLAEQLDSPHPGVRHDAIRMAKEVMTSWRGDHTALLTRLADRLVTNDPYTAAEVAEALRSVAPIAEPAREPLAEFVEVQRTAHGPEVWAMPDPSVRRAHQQAVMALARLGDPRALPSLLVALDTGVDAWRAVQVAASLSAAAGQLVPRLCRELERFERSPEQSDMGVSALLSALGRLGDASAVPVIAETVTAAMRSVQWPTAATALNALAAFGPTGAPALGVIRGVTGTHDPAVRVAAAGALWAIEGRPEEVLPLLEDLLDSHCKHEAVDVLGRIGPAASRVVPRLRRMLTAGYEWTRVHAATALWDIGGPDEAPQVLEILLDAWRTNEFTANNVIACLDRMGPAAAPAVPLVRSELARPRRGGRFHGVENDEELQRVSRAFLLRHG